MAALFDTLNAAAETQADILHAEPFSFQPMRTGVNARGAVDTGRSAIPSLMVVFQEPGQRLAQGLEGPAFVSDSPLALIRSPLLPQGIRKGDRLTRQSDGLKYEVRAVRRETGDGRKIVELAEIP